MFDYRQLYQAGEFARWYIQFYSEGMQHICRVTDGSGLDTAASALGLVSIAKPTTGLPLCSQFLYARDNFGKQFHLALTGEVKDAWQQCMQLGLDAEEGIAGKTFRILYTWADAVYASILGSVTNDDLIFLSGHGLGGAVMALVGLKLKKAGKKIQQVYLNASCGFCTEPMLVEFNGQPGEPIALPCFWMGLPEDELSDAPPSPLFFAKWWGGNAQVLAECFTPGLGQRWLRHGRPRVGLGDTLDVTDPLGWPSRIPDTMSNYNSTVYYIRGMRARFANTDYIRGLLAEMVSLLNTGYLTGLPLLAA